MAERPLVSVVTPFLNAERFIQETIESVFSQSYDAWELLLVDDGSADRSTAIARSYAAGNPDRVVYLEHEGHRNHGIPASRNAGIQNGRGKYVAFLDADDVWLPHKLGRQVAIMESEPRAGMVYGFSLYWYSWTGAADDLERDWIPDLGLPTDRLFDPPELFRRVYPFGQATPPAPTSCLVRRSALESIGNFEEEFRGFYHLHEDQAFLVKMYLNWPIFVSSEKWDKCRFHPDSCCASTLKGGHYDSCRAFFLKWFQSWLSRRNIEDPDIWRMLRKAVQTARVQLRTAGNGVARILYGDHSEQVRIEIEKASPGAPFDIQLNCPFYEMRAHHRYAIRFRAKADRPRNIYAGIALAHAPWTGIGMYRELPLRSDWEDFHLEFIAIADDANVRIHFDLGESEVPVDIGSLSMRLLPSERLVEPSLALIPTDELFSR